MASIRESVGGASAKNRAMQLRWEPIEFLNPSLQKERHSVSASKASRSIKIIFNPHSKQLHNIHIHVPFATVDDPQEVKESPINPPMAKAIAKRVVSGYAIQAPFDTGVIEKPINGLPVGR